MSDARLSGLVLAAGEGRRFGGPKALAHCADGTPWVVRAVEMLRAGGCADVMVALGASADEAALLVPPEAVVVRVPDWQEGVAATLRRGLRAADVSADALIVTPVDTPEASPKAVARVVEVAACDMPQMLAQAVYHGAPGHPVLIGQAHWKRVAAEVSGDAGARRYLLTHAVVEVECSDLWSGADIDAVRLDG